MYIENKNIIIHIQSSCVRNNIELNKYIFTYTY